MRRAAGYMPSRPLGAEIQPFLAVDAMYLLMVYVPAFASEQDVNTMAAIAHASLCYVTDTQPQGRIVLPD